MSNAIEKWLAQPASIDQIQHHAPPGFDADQAKRSVLALMQADSVQGGSLGRCSPRSLVLAVVQAAALGLELGTGDAYVIPYKGEATLSVGYRGMIKLAKRSGEILHLKAEVVYEGEHFDYSVANGAAVLEHTLSFPRSNGEVVAVYCSIVCHDGFVDYEVMDAGEIEKVKQASEAKMHGKTSPAWKAWASEMAKKAVIRRALKRYTLGSTVESIFDHEDRIIFTQAEVRATRPAVSPQQLTTRLLGLESAPSQTPDEAPAEVSPPPADAGASDGDSFARSFGQLLSGVEGPVEEAKARLSGMDEATQEEWHAAIKDADKDQRAELVAEIVGGAS